MTYKIISGQYEAGTEEQQAGYKMLFGEDNIQYKFDLYFHWYNIVHELGHCVVDAQNINMSKVQEEMFVNEFAVAYWRYIGAEVQLKELEDILNRIMTNINSPVPSDIGFVEYYESIWGMDVLNNVMVYGYFQLNSVLEALKGKKDFKTVCKFVGIDLYSDISMSKYEGAICAENAYKVLEHAVTNINMLNINPIQVSIELVDNPMIQCAQPKMNKVLCSTGAINGKPNGYDYKLLGTLSKQLLCDGFELMIDKPWYQDIEALKSYLQELKLYIPVVHCEKSIGEMISKGTEADLAEAYHFFELDCDVARSVGAEKLVLHLWGGRTSDSNFQSNLNAYQCVNEIALKYGLDLLVENVVCNVENPMKHLCELKEKYPQIHFVFDTKMAAFHEQLELLYEAEYDWLWKDGHIRHYHVNDYAGGYMDWSNLRTLPIGKGKVDFERFFDFMKKIEYEGDFTVEATAFDGEGVIDVEMLNEQFRCIRERMK